MLGLKVNKVLCSAKGFQNNKLSSNNLVEMIRDNLPIKFGIDDENK